MHHIATHLRNQRKEEMNEPETLHQRHTQGERDGVAEENRRKEEWRDELNTQVISEDEDEHDEEERLCLFLSLSIYWCMYGLVQCLCDVWKSILPYSLACCCSDDDGRGWSGVSLEVRASHLCVRAVHLRRKSHTSAPIRWVTLNNSYKDTKHRKRRKERWKRKNDSKKERGVFFLFYPSCSSTSSFFSRGAGSVGILIYLRLIYLAIFDLSIYMKGRLHTYTDRLIKDT